MDTFLQGAVCSITILGGICGFMWYIFTSMEKRMEQKFDMLAADIHRVANELHQERIDKSNLYNFVLNTRAGKK